MTDLTHLSITKLRQGLAEKTFSAAEITEQYFQRVERFDPEVGAFLTVASELAKQQAKAVDEMVANTEELPPLAGVPFAIKDNILVKGIRATAGSKILEPYVASYDSTVIERLRLAGAILLGKTNLDEFGMGSSTENSAFKTTKNPWDLSRVPGGSSGGSAAAVSARLCLAALGSDTGGSIRQPASLCGVVGFKPTYGRVSRYGLIAMTSSLDQIGPLTLTVEDAALVYSIIAGPDPRDSTTVRRPIPKPEQSASLNGRTIGILEDSFTEGVDPDVATTVRQAIAQLTKLGAKTKSVNLPLTKYALPVYYVMVTSEISSNLARYDGIRYGQSAVSRQPSAVKNLYEVYTKSRAAGFGPEAKRRIILGTFALSAGYSDRYYKKAQALRQLIREEYEAAFREVDCILTPTSPTVAFRLGERVDDPLTMYRSDIDTVSANIAGLCGISVPCGFVEGLPVGLQLLGKPYDEATILDIAAAYQHATDWHTVVPNI